MRELLEWAFSFLPEGEREGHTSKVNFRILAQEEALLYVCVVADFQPGSRALERHYVTQ